MKSEAQKFFNENGYYLGRNVYSAQEILQLEEEFDRVVRQIRKSDVPHSGPNAAEDNGIVSMLNIQKLSALWLTKGLLHKGFLDMAEQFIGNDIILQRTSLYEKRKSNVLGPFRMHQDWIYGPTRKDTMVSGMIHVGRTTAPMGALRVYPGTHRTRIENSWADDMGAAFHKQFPLEKAKVLEAEAGDVLFFHYCLVHGSMSNQTETPRKVVHARMFAGQDCRENDEQGFENLVLRGWNSYANATST